MLQPQQAKVTTHSAFEMISSAFVFPSRTRALHKSEYNNKINAKTNELIRLYTDSD